MKVLQRFVVCCAAVGVAFGAANYFLKEDDTISPSDSCSNGTVFVTDLEGFFDYAKLVFEKLVARGIMKPVPDGKTFENHYNQLEMQDGWCMVLGGDMVDRGSGSILSVSAAVYLKERYRKRVLLIGGNRDYNKVRWLCEGELEGQLKKKHTKTAVANLKSNVSGAASSLYSPFWKEEISRSFDKPNTGPSPVEALKSRPDFDPEAASDDDLGHLLYVYGQTMGVPTGKRIDELKIILGKGGNKVTHTELLNSLRIDMSFVDIMAGSAGTDFLEDSNYPDTTFKKLKRMSDYLLLSQPIGQLELSNGKKILYAHGGISENNFLVKFDDRVSKSGNLNEWIEQSALGISAILDGVKAIVTASVNADPANRAAALGCDNYTQHKTGVFKIEPTAYYKLTDIAIGSAQHYDSKYKDWVVTNRDHVDDANLLEIVPLNYRRKMIEIMISNDILGMFFGHTPRGSSTLATADSQGHFIVMADNSLLRDQKDYFDIVYFDSRAQKVVNYGKLASENRVVSYAVKDGLAGMEYMVDSSMPIFGKQYASGDPEVGFISARAYKAENSGADTNVKIKSAGTKANFGLPFLTNQMGLYDAASETDLPAESLPQSSAELNNLPQDKVNFFCSKQFSLVLKEIGSDPDPKANLAQFLEKISIAMREIPLPSLEFLSPAVFELLIHPNSSMAVPANAIAKSTAASFKDKKFVKLMAAKMDKLDSKVVEELETEALVIFDAADNTKFSNLITSATSELFKKVRNHIRRFSSKCCAKIKTLVTVGVPADHSGWNALSPEDVQSLIIAKPDDVLKEFNSLAQGDESLRAGSASFIGNTLANFGLLDASETIKLDAKALQLAVERGEGPVGAAINGVASLHSSRSIDVTKFFAHLLTLSASIKKEQLDQLEKDAVLQLKDKLRELMSKGSKSFNQTVADNLDQLSDTHLDALDVAGFRDTNVPKLGSVLKAHTATCDAFRRSVAANFDVLTSKTLEGIGISEFKALRGLSGIRLENTLRRANDRPDTFAKMLREGLAALGSALLLPAEMDALFSTLTDRALDANDFKKLLLREEVISGIAETFCNLDPAKATIGVMGKFQDSVFGDSAVGSCVAGAPASAFFASQIGQMDATIKAGLVLSQTDTSEGNLVIAAAKFKAGQDVGAGVFAALVSQNPQICGTMDTLSQLHHLGGPEVVDCAKNLKATNKFSGIGAKLAGAHPGLFEILDAQAVRQMTSEELGLITKDQLSGMKKLASKPAVGSDENKKHPCDPLTSKEFLSQLKNAGGADAVRAICEEKNFNSSSAKMLTASLLGLFVATLAAILAV